MGVLVALQGLKDYWQYVLIAALLVITVVLKANNTSLRYDVSVLKQAVAQRDALIDQLADQAKAQQKRYAIAEKEVQVMKKEQTMDLNALQAALKMDNNTPCDAAIMQGIKAAKKAGL